MPISFPINAKCLRAYCLHNEYKMGCCSDRGSPPRSQLQDFSNFEVELKKAEENCVLAKIRFKKFVKVLDNTT